MVLAWAFIEILHLQSGRQYRKMNYDQIHANLNSLETYETQLLEKASKSVTTEDLVVLSEMFRIQSNMLRLQIENDQINSPHNENFLLDFTFPFITLSILLHISYQLKTIKPES